MTNKPEYNTENCARLAEEIVKNMDLDDLMDSAALAITEHYKNNPDLFYEEWGNYFDDTH